MSNKSKTAKNDFENKKSSITLDIKHKEFLNEFIKDENLKIPEYKIERQKLKTKLKSQINELSIEEHLDLQDSINELTEKIQKIKNKKKNYFLDNSQYIFEYFETKKNISSSNNNTISNSKVNTFFKIKNKEPINNFLKIENNIVQKYLTNINETYLDIDTFIYQKDICQNCYKGELIPLEDEGLLLCNNCSRSIRYLIEKEKPSYKDPPKELSFYAYKRINHFKEILSQFQGKETTQIPDIVIENIKLQIKKERLNIENITNSKTKEILKKLSYNKYYEHIPFIKNKLGIKPPLMSPELEETLYNLFTELQWPYSKYCPIDRVNFLNYYYTAYKLCELLGEDKYLPLFPLLKDRAKRIEQDEIWGNICKDLNWEFIPTI